VSPAVLRRALLRGILGSGNAHHVQDSRAVHGSQHDLVELVVRERKGAFFPGTRSSRWNGEAVRSRFHVDGASAGGLVEPDHSERGAGKAGDEGDGPAPTPCVSITSRSCSARRSGSSCPLLCRSREVEVGAPNASTWARKPATCERSKPPCSRRCRKTPASAADRTPAQDACPAGAPAAQSPCSPARARRRVPKRRHPSRLQRDAGAHPERDRRGDLSHAGARAARARATRHAA